MVNGHEKFVVVLVKVEKGSRFHDIELHRSSQVGECIESTDQLFTK
jgi:hypothetical protein